MLTPSMARTTDSDVDSPRLSMRPSQVRGRDSTTTWSPVTARTCPQRMRQRSKTVSAVAAFRPSLSRPVQG